MGVPPRIPRFSESNARVEDVDFLTNSEFCELAITDSQQEYEDDFGVIVYNLGECELPVGLDIDGYSDGYFILMDVGEPVTITSRASLFASTFTTYLIRVETNYPTLSTKFCTVRRRYNEFCWLREQLIKNHPDRQVPQIPPKRLLPFSNFNASFISQRMKGLSRFLQRVLENPTFLRDQSLLFFLQADISVAELVELQRANKGTAVASRCPPSSVEISISSSGEGSLINPLLRSDGEEEDDNVDLNLAKGSVQSSESSDFGQFGHNANKAQPIPVPFSSRKNKLDCDDRLYNSSSSSEGDSGHFDASSSVSMSPNPMSPAQTYEGRPHNELIHQHNKASIMSVRSNTSSLFTVNEYLLCNPTVACYMMQ